jgi:lipid-A-disaccharide synthase
MKYYFIAGEASGDLHGSNLAKALLLQDSNATIQGWGGDLMQSAGVVITKHYRELAFMGFVEVAKNIRTIFKNFKRCKEDIGAFNPDTVVLIDYPGFNLRMAKWAKEQGYKVVYYISPQIWAWKESRIHTIKKYVDEMIVILPFEKAFYKKHNYKVHYVGHPLLTLINDFKAKQNRLELMKDLSLTNDKIIALLPGSRQQEISIKLPIMLSAAKHFPSYQFVVARAPGTDDSFYSSMLTNYNNVTTVENKTYQLLSVAEAALVTSGTATLEAGLFKVPQVICYKGGKISYELAKRLIKIKFIGLVNLILDRAVVMELIQDELNETNLIKELTAIIEAGKKRSEVLKGYDELHQILQTGQDASTLAATIIYNTTLALSNK